MLLNVLTCLSCSTVVLDRGFCPVKSVIAVDDVGGWKGSWVFSSDGAFVFRYTCVGCFLCLTHVKLFTVLAWDYVEFVGFGYEVGWSLDYDGCRMSVRCLDSSYVGEPGRDIIGRSGMFGCGSWGMSCCQAFLDLLLTWVSYWCLKLLFLWG